MTLYSQCAVANPSGRVELLEHLKWKQTHLQGESLNILIYGAMKEVARDHI